ncbi:hypothetical protein PRN20_18685 [Devosia sp. ZB163]|nr:hypothetical protein [Devosia sp. ZB163]MDC9825766.1 hypothetical protein [Devosia sp. ZB163]
MNTVFGRALIHMGLLGLNGWIAVQFWRMPEPWPHLIGCSGWGSARAAPA